LSEVKLLLANYESLLGNGIAHPNEREHDYPELPMALPLGETVWQGIIDRLYCANGQWYLEDYKTDQEIEPEKYYFQLAVYLKAIEEVRGVRPEVRLVFLREKQISFIEHPLLQQALLTNLTSLEATVKVV
jgi:ATP-dependent exoDNAse (exonuclease V) beta subunit